MHDLTPVVVDLRRDDAPEALGSALSSERPLILLAGLGTSERLVWKPGVRALLRHPMPVTAVLQGRVCGPAAGLLLACDALLLSPRSSLRFDPSGRGEAVLLALRLGHGAACRVWFSGGELAAREAARSGWAEMAKGGLAEALESARRRYQGLSSEAIALLRPLLVRQVGLPLLQAHALERAAFALVFDTRHPAEGVAAFMEKRKPKF
jgi:enoyl-CoA hydratase/carnithine racemase